jgi:UDPglucose--hexose-1-phosphate uridylyltransferase
VAIAVERQKRPNDFKVERVTVARDEVCPFCPGHEDMTPPEVYAQRPDGSPPNTPGWTARVVPNRYPALRVEGTLDREGDGMFDRMSGVGAHEVIIETPDHAKDFATMGEGEIVGMLAAWRDRILDLKRDFRFRYIVVFKNQGGAAGATLEHPHCQLIALPLVPDLVREELTGAKRHFDDKQRCIFCDIVHQELSDGRRIVLGDGHVIALAPWASRLPFETWLLPRQHGSRFEEAPWPELESLARALQALIARMNRALDTPPFNLILHTAPLAEDVGAHFHWHLEVMPKLSRVAGFEWGTGFYINPVAPEEAADVLRRAAESGGAAADSGGVRL